MVLILIIVNKKEAMKFTNLILSCILLAACASTLHTNSTPNETMIQNSIALLDDVLFEEAQAPIQIDTVLLEGNLLKIQYRTSTPKVEMQLVGSTSIAKSFPPIRHCKLIEIGPKNREAKTLLNFPVELHCDVQILTTKRTSGSPTYLQIEGWPEKILYLYSE